MICAKRLRSSPSPLYCSLNTTAMKFNLIKKSKYKVRNHEGAKAYTLDAKTELYSAVVNTSLSNMFYESANDRVERIRALIAKNDPAFVARLAVYARTHMHMRSIPLVLAVELAKQASGNNLVSKTVKGVVRRADEITELLAYYQLANERTNVKKLNKLSKQIQHGLAAAFNQFDEYQFAKYNRAAAVRLKDALFLVHPKAVNEGQQAIFNKIATDTLEVPFTWETTLSAVGQVHYKNTEAKQAAIAQTWTMLIESGKLGYMALLRNLRNIINAEVSGQTMARVCHTLSSRHAVVNAKQLPFRFLAAYREVRALHSGMVPMVLDALEQAVAHSAANVRGFDYNTSVVIACDVSGSMQRPISAKSKVMCYDIGLMLAMLLQSRCARVQTGMFGNTWKIMNVSHQNILANVQTFYQREGEVGYATNGYLVVKDLIDRRQVVDKVMLFTDCQLWGDDISKYWMHYKQMAPHAKLYLFDLSGYGNTPLDVRAHDVHLIAGWSDKVFDVLAALEQGEDAMQAIEMIEL